MSKYEVAELSSVLALCSGAAVFGSGGGTLLWHNGSWKTAASLAGAEVGTGRAGGGGVRVCVYVCVYVCVCVCVCV